MDSIRFFKAQSKLLYKDYKTRYFNEKENIYAYKPIHYDIGSIFQTFGFQDHEFVLQKAQHLIARMAGFNKWNELIIASEPELDLAKSHLQKFQIKQDKQHWEGTNIDKQDINSPSDRKVKYFSALDEDGNLIYIDDLSEGTRDQHSYRCPYCNGPMIPVLGKKNTHHFRHDGEHCSYESYLHKLAKLRLKEAFEQRDEFLVETVVDNACDRFDECVLRERGLVSGCKDSYETLLNLKNYYDICELEKEHNGYTADVLLRDSRGVHEPMFLEIYVSHPCDVEKIQSGIPIIEFKINNEEDLNELLNQKIFREQRNVQVPNKKKKTEDKVLFYNLKRLGLSKPYELETIRQFARYDASGLFGHNTYHSINFSLQGLYVCPDEESGHHKMPMKCHDFNPEVQGIPNAILLNPRLDNLDREYVERCILVMNGKKNPCCEQCKHVERKPETINVIVNPKYPSWPWTTKRLHCTKGGRIKREIRNIYGNIIDSEDSLYDIQIPRMGYGANYVNKYYGYDVIHENEYKCEHFELDIEKIKKDIEQYGLIGKI